MASRRGLSSGVDAVDVATVMSFFQGMNRVRLTVEMEVVDDGPVSSMRLQLTAWQLSDPTSAVPPSVLVSVRRMMEARQSMEAAILQLLYAVDFQLALKEYGGDTSSGLPLAAPKS